MADVNYTVNRDDKTKITGTSDADWITNSGSKVTIQSGKGNDTIEGSNNGEMFLFGQTDGNNLIINFGKNDTNRHRYSGGNGELRLSAKRHRRR